MATQDIEAVAKEAFDKSRLKFEDETDNATIPWEDTAQDIREWWLSWAQLKREKDGACN